ncbi:hypothetical protein BGZ76_006457 [Entomortierella beljakovae]|nr:hypothetical protein BGZ76_006457 [Entomortierella beljakovae]
MDYQYQYLAQTPASGYTQQLQYPHDQYSYNTGHDTYNSNNYQYNASHDIHSNHLNSLNGSNHTTTNSNKSNNEDSDLGHISKSHKGKIFQCTGFGDCRMVFTRSEHLARHARKHTGEKPFQCVVEGCTRMFSRFDNMVQHTQTHTKGAHRETAEGIANKIAIESRRKSEAGLLGSSTTRNGGAKCTRSKRGSISANTSSELLNKTRRERIMSIPMLNVEAASAHQRSSGTILPSPVTPSATSPHSPRKQSQHRSKTLGREGGKICKKQCMTKSRRGSLESSIQLSPTESYYTSKLHHRTSLDYGVDRNTLFDGMNNRADTAHSLQKLPPLNYRSTDLSYHQSPQRSPSFSSLRHPLSPEHSSHSDIDSDDCSSVQGHQSILSSDEHLSMEDCKLPPLRPSGIFPEDKPRLPSINYGRIRSQSIAYHSPSYVPEPSLAHNNVRRLSLVDLNAPIQEATIAVNHSMQAPLNNQSSGSVDVSEDEIKALEAFGELWSQGRGVEVSEDQLTATASRMDAEAPAPGPDVGRRAPLENEEVNQRYNLMMSNTLE